MPKGITNIVTGKIIGVLPGTHAHYHEVGHLEYQNTEQGIKDIHLREILKDILIPGMLLTFLWLPLIFIPGGIYIMVKFLDIKEERWCWDFADKKIEDEA